MTTIQFLLNLVLHLDEHLIAFVTNYGTWTYVVLFAIVFSETGIFFLGFLPGDSLLFATGALSAQTADILNVHILFILLVIASVSGNCLNYFVGKWIGPRLFRGDAWILNKRHVYKAHAFFERYGGKTIMIARFIPIVRTIAPFIAGIGYMTFRPFFIYSLMGAFLWIGSLVYGSYLFGNIPVVKQHFSLVILLIIALSLTPPIFEIIRMKLRARQPGYKPE